jgi:hypothetical protein
MDSNNYYMRHSMTDKKMHIAQGTDWGGKQDFKVALRKSINSNTSILQFSMVKASNFPPRN